MPPNEDKAESFSYIGQNRQGQPITGTIDAPAIDEAQRKLESLQLRLSELKPVPRPPGARALREDDFLAFNQQLAALAAANLPIELGLRLIAEDLHSGRLAGALKDVGADLESGKSLPQAIDAHRDRFPALYSRVVDAGVRSGNLPGTLLNLSRHITLLRSLRATLWRIAAYPLAILAASAGVLVFLSFGVLPQFEAMFADFHAELPLITRAVMSFSRVIRSYEFWIGVGLVVVVGAIIWQVLGRLGLARKIVESLSLRTPLIAPVIRRSLIARWCDAMHVGIQAGLDLPAAIALAGDTIASPALRADGQALIAELNAGNSIRSAPPGKLIPVTAVAAMQLAIERNNLSETLASLSNLYQKQAELRVASVHAWLTPLLLLTVGAVIFFIILALFAPFMILIQSISGGPPKPHL